MKDSSELDPCKLANNLFAYLMLKKDYDVRSGLRKKVLVVEGNTDSAFFTRIARNDTRYICVADFMLGHLSMMSSRPPKPQWANNKEAIIKLIKHFFIQESLGLSPTVKNLPVFGLVDNDFDTDSQYLPYSKLFFTGTHDIETLMLSTDQNLLFRIPNCTISEEEIMRALYVAAQLSFFRQAIHKAKIFDQIRVADAEGIIHYASFTSDDRINLYKLLDYANDNSEQPLSKSKMKKNKDQLAVDLKKNIDKDGYWKKSFDSFPDNIDDDFWRKVNGHDILSAIRYINPSVHERFSNRQRYKLNRDFELALSKSYDYTCFIPTDLYSRLIKAELITPCGHVTDNM